MLGWGSCRWGPAGCRECSGSSKRENETTKGLEEIRYTSPITRQSIDGKIWWDYGIGDHRYREKGYTMPDNILPTVNFGFNNISPPNHMDIVITSYWSKISPTRSEPKLPNRTQIHKLLRLFKSTGKTQCSVSFSNLFQIVALTANMDNLMKRNHYKAKVKMYLDSGITSSGPPQPEEQRLEAESLKGIERKFVVVDADRKCYIMITLLRLT